MKVASWALSGNEKALSVLKSNPQGVTITGAEGKKYILVLERPKGLQGSLVVL
jgi:hypothetical protein